LDVPRDAVTISLAAALSAAPVILSFSWTTWYPSEEGGNYVTRNEIGSSFTLIVASFVSIGPEIGGVILFIEIMNTT